MYIHISFKLLTNTLSTNKKRILYIYLISKKVKNNDHLRFFPYFYNHNKNLCEKFTNLWVFLENH